jgi:hypothetical protein
MPVLELFGFEIDYHYVVSIDSNALETHDDVKVIFMLMTLNFSMIVLIIGLLVRCLHNKEVAISDIQFILPFDQKAVLEWILLVDFKEIIPKL